jgi:hypothetical protein
MCNIFIRLMRVVRNLYVANSALKYFMINQWEFNNANNLTLISSIPLNDRNIFSYDWTNIDMRDILK